LVYAIAFLVAINQIIPLIGSHGLTPISIYLKNVSAALGSNGAGFMRLPSIFWVWHSDAALLSGAWIGFILSCMVFAGFANAPMLTGSLGSLYVLCSFGTGMVWIWLGNSTY
jgi:hypothetical protein